MLLRHRRLILFCCLVMTIFAGLASRQVGDLRKEVGDAFWATAAYWGIALVIPWWSRRRVAVAAGVLAFAVEFSQLYHAPWIDAIRRYRLGHLLIGSGFHWPDLPAYVVGIALACLLDFSALAMTRRNLKT